MPDSLTRLAMDDLRRSGLRKFVDDFVQEVEQDSLLRWGATKLELQKAVRAKILNAMGDTISRSLPSPREAIQHFSRAALCTPSWPNITHQRDYTDAKSRLSAVIKGVQECLDYLRNGRDLPLFALARAVGSRFFSGRTQALEVLLELYCLQHNSSASRENASRHIIRVLSLHDRYTQRTFYPFQPSALRMRCLLWVFSQVLTLEAKILCGLAALLRSAFRLRAGQTRPKPGIFDKRPQFIVYPSRIVLSSDD
ncbi:hypothetical protein C7999DRAFT_35205 [Corynascus novoguineensis]|uniref:Uncharacterized protein n=1 Tax=Corynascus novoguineensis TaxID=1126955 RepID=A0AAN7HC79_9PEZI|nr:hypothetical protein C7999DRAFT_35205 [Corynascus novoguineensis]